MNAPSIIRFISVIFVLVLSTDGAAQAVNDDCTTATDITPAFDTLGNDSFQSCHMGNGTIATGLGGFQYSFQNATISNPNYISDNCYGIAQQTSPHLADIWFKFAVADIDNGYKQGFHVFAFDTLQIATYQGTCSSLVQVDCFTPEPYSFWDLMTISDSADTDTMYIQLRSNTTPPYEFFCIDAFSANTYYTSTRPAIVWSGSTSMTAQSRASVNIYPNPASEFIYIDNVASFQSIEIFDLFGSSIKKVNDKGDKSIPIETFMPGTYIIRMIDKDMRNHIALFNKS